MDIRDTVRMANQIGEFFKSYPEQEALDGIADHINKFWEPRMRRIFFAHADAGGADFSAIIKKSVPMIKRPKAASAPCMFPRPRGREHVIPAAG